jgi:hypothetical protein
VAERSADLGTRRQGAASAAPCLLLPGFLSGRALVVERHIGHVQPRKQLDDTASFSTGSESGTPASWLRKTASPPTHPEPAVVGQVEHLVVAQPDCTPSSPTTPPVCAQASTSGVEDVRGIPPTPPPGVGGGWVPVLPPGLGPVDPRRRSGEAPPGFCSSRAILG